MGPQDFISGLRELQYKVEAESETRVLLEYNIPIGPRLGEVVRLGFEIPADWPLTPPSGPRICPRILPIHPDQSGGHPSGGVHEASDFGDDWEYWSRPFQGWAETDRTVQTYMSFINKLFETL